jgi:hypothetical protein
MYHFFVFDFILRILSSGEVVHPFIMLKKNFMVPGDHLADIVKFLISLKNHKINFGQNYKS